MLILLLEFEFLYYMELHFRYPVLPSPHPLQSINFKRYLHCSNVNQRIDAEVDVLSLVFSVAHVTMATSCTVTDQ